MFVEGVADGGGVVMVEDVSCCYTAQLSNNNFFTVIIYVYYPSQYLHHIVVELKASGLPHVLNVWLGLSQGMLLINSFATGSHLYLLGVDF